MFKHGEVCYINYGITNNESRKPRYRCSAEYEGTDREKVEDDAGRDGDEKVQPKRTSKQNNGGKNREAEQTVNYAGKEKSEEPMPIECRPDTFNGAADHQRRFSSSRQTHKCEYDRYSSATSRCSEVVNARVRSRLPSSRDYAVTQGVLRHAKAKSD